MCLIQVALIACCLLISSVLIIKLFRIFTQQQKMALFFIAPLGLFCLGFIFRLSGTTPIINLGYFFTEFAQIFVSVLFGACLILGQVKYWRK
jgi:hypothetical protein